MTEHVSGHYRTGAAVPGIGPIIAVTLFQGHIFAVRATEDNPGALFMLAPDATVWRQIHPHKEQQQRALMLRLTAGLRTLTAAMQVRIPQHQPKDR